MVGARALSGQADADVVGDTSGRDLVFTDRDFVRIRGLIHARAGIALAEHKTEMAYSRLARRLRALRLTRFDDYLGLLETSPAHPEWEHFVNALTTNLTAFFREAYHFPLLAAHARNRRRPLAVWCCAASTGEEAYSIAMTLVETLGERAASASILASDIDTRALARAQAGIYPLAEVEKLSETRRKRFFQRGSGTRAGLARVTPALRSMIEFRPLNLRTHDWDLSGPFDAIFCRNLMIYFDQATQKALLDRFAALIAPDGLLFAGHSENFSGLTSAFTLRSHTVYERAARVRVAS
ncbi:CheR family methyltransferase [Salinisphaera sp. T31B1]|uniref:CheR family methyltransferase n=1 Tax=Salinisphaera sp. T31B1 TaxID=727963 RepID=UPI00333FA56C